MAFLVRNFTIGYLHLIFLGFVTIFLIAWFAAQKFLQLNGRLATWGVWLLLIGFAGSELYIFLQPLFFKYHGGAIPFYNPTLFAFSVLMPLGTGLFVWASFGLKKAYRKSEKGVIRSLNS